MPEPTTPQSTTTTTIQQATTGQEPVQFAHTFPDGRKFTTDDPVKLQAEIDKSYKHLHDHVKTVEKENAHYRTQIEKPQPPPNGYDPTTYWELWGSDPLKAQEYLDQYNPAHQQTKREIVDNKIARNSNVFVENNPEFQPTTENVAKLAETIKGLYPHLLRNNEFVDAPTPDQIQAAHLYAINQKFYTLETVGGKTMTETPKPPVPPVVTSTPSAQQGIDIGNYPQTPEGQAKLRKDIEAAVAAGTLK